MNNRQFDNPDRRVDIKNRDTAKIIHGKSPINPFAQQYMLSDAIVDKQLPSINPPNTPFNSPNVGIINPPNTPINSPNIGIINPPINPPNIGIIPNGTPTGFISVQNQSYTQCSITLKDGKIDTTADLYEYIEKYTKNLKKWQKE